MLFTEIFFNRYFDKNRIKSLILWNLNKYGEKKTLDLVENLKNFGFSNATKAGLSLGIDDLRIPPTKKELILETEFILQSSKKNYKSGNITIVENFQQLIDVWHRTSEILKQNVVDHFRATDILNPVYMMAFSGARGNISQVRQLVGMRGLMADPQGQILDFSIRSNFREGLTLTEYVISCYGARKGLVDTALRTANSGYLTRRLVDVAQHVIIKQFDCGTTNGIIITEMKNGKKIILPLHKRLIGRVLAESIEKIANKNKDISPSLALKISQLKKQVLVRSPLSCRIKNSICQLCYGWSLAHGSLVSRGEAVGILAAQSIGEPGTQLTMRTFHTGGVFSGEVMQEIRSPFSGIVNFLNPLQGILIRTLHGKIAFLTKIEGQLLIVNKIETLRTQYSLPISSILFSREGELVKERQLLAEYSSVVMTSNQGIQANYNLNSPNEGQIYFEDVLMLVKSGEDNDNIKIALKFGSLWVLSGKLYQSVIRSNLFIKSNDLVDTNSLINELIFITPYSGDVEKYKEKKSIYKISYNTNNSFYKEKNYLNKLVNGEKDYNPKKINSLYNNKNSSTTEIYINQNFFKFYFKNIEYKKFGYFITFSNLKNKKLFLKNSLKQNTIDLKLISLNWILKKNPKKIDSIITEKKFFNEEKGQYFIKLNKIYKVPIKKIFEFSINDKNLENFNENFITFTTPTFDILKKETISNYFILNNYQKFQKNSKNFLLINKQENKISLSFMKNGFIKKLSKTTIEKFDFFPIKIEKKNKKFLKNPNIRLVKLKQLQIKLPIKKKIIKNSSITFFSKLNKNKIRKKNFNYKVYSFLKPNYQNFQKKQHISKYSSVKKEINSFLYSKTQKIQYLKFQIQVGWIIIPKMKITFYLFKKLFLAPTYKKINYNFDQNYITLETNSIKNSILFFKKIYFRNKIRYIKNSFFRYNKTHIFKKNYNRNNKILHKSFFENKKSFIFNSNKEILRNKIYKKNFIYTSLVLIEIEKTIELEKSTIFEKKDINKKARKDYKNFTNFKVKELFLNKQKITPLKNSYPNPELEIFSNSKKISKRNPNWFLNSKKLYFKTKKSFPIKKGKYQLKFDQSINFKIYQKVESGNIIFNKKTKTKTIKNKIVITRKNQVSRQNNFTINSFFSPFGAEILTVQKDFIGQEKSLLLTGNDKISFLSNQKQILTKLGQLIRFGDEIIKNTSSIESGQIVQIDKNKITLRKAQPILFSSQGVFHVENGTIIEKNAPIMTLFYQKLKTEDIIQGIPKIEELFEARQKKDGEILQENLHTKLKKFFNYYKQQHTQQKATRKSIETIQQILVNNVQKVYQSQGVSIADKHIEIIVRQMTTKVKITEHGRTGFFRGELVELEKVEKINLGIQLHNKMAKEFPLPHFLNHLRVIQLDLDKAQYEPIILGITKAALETESFISAASFQETTRILSRAAIEYKEDYLRGLKENVILGNLIPAGTGFNSIFQPVVEEKNSINKISWLSYDNIFRMYNNNNENYKIIISIYNQINLKK